MPSSYLIVHKSILPDYYEKVLECRRLMESGKVREVSQAVKQVGISRSTYYKYKDFIFEPSDLTGSRTAAFSMMGVSISIDELTTRLAALPGLDNLRLLAIE